MNKEWNLYLMKYVSHLLLYSGIILSFHTAGQSSNAAIRIVWYNVENAFDTIDDPGVLDEEYLPTSPKRWNSRKYWSKLRRIAKVIRNASGENPPDVVGLCEIENRKVLGDLTYVASWTKIDYHIVHYDSPDRRGIDVGLLYNPNTIKMFHSRAISVHFPSDSTKRTRDILLASGCTSYGDTVHFFLNHWPSRRGGIDYSESFRVESALTLGDVVDSIREYSPHHLVVIMGDFNDGPNDVSIQTLESFGVVSLMKDLPHDLGTHRYKGEWEYLDQWLLSTNVGNGPLQIDSSYIYYSEAMIEQSTSYPGFRPRRCWLGDFFTSGYSDHLPIVLILSHTSDSNINEDY